MRAGQGNELLMHLPVIQIQMQDPEMDEPLVAPELTSTIGGAFIRSALAEISEMELADFYTQFNRPDAHACFSVFDPTYHYFYEITQPDDLSTHIDENSFLLDMLMTNGGCELPFCWWGIAPSETRWEETEQTLLTWQRTVSSQTITLRERNNDGEYSNVASGVFHQASLFSRQTSYPHDYTVHHSFFEQDSVVQLLGVSARSLGGETFYARSWPRSSQLLEDWQSYTLDQVLARYGVPTQVLVYHWPRDHAPFGIALLYEPDDIMFIYMGAVQLQADGQLAICPAREHIEDINIWLRATDFDVPFDTIYRNYQIGGYHSATTFPNAFILTIEEAVGMSVETFFEIYLDPDAEQCLYPVELTVLCQ